jgi:hypothetical protein
VTVLRAAAAAFYQLRWSKDELAIYLELHVREVWVWRKGSALGQLLAFARCIR